MGNREGNQSEPGLWETDGYRIRNARIEDAGAMAALMESVYETLENKDIYVCDDEEYVREQLLAGGIGAIVLDAVGEMAGIFLVTFPGEDEKNLGFEMGLSGTELLRVAHMDTAAVLPKHRGHRLERRMFTYLEARMPEEIRYLMGTVSPENPASIRSFEGQGYRLLCTKEKYGGLLRRIYVKEI